jgi:prepilin peptidase CpaA
MPDLITDPSLIATLLALLTVALLTDLHSRQIPNLLVGVGLVIGLAGHAWFAGTAGVLTAGLGACVGLLCLLPFYVSGAMGGGDVKLMAMCGAFLGPINVIVATTAALLIGGLLGAVWLFWRFTATRHEYADDQDTVSIRPTGGDQAPEVMTIPYALAIAAGVIVALESAPAIYLAFAGGAS